MSARATSAFLVRRLGPYHDARLRAFASARMGTVHAVEFRPSDGVYEWSPVPDEGTYERLQVKSRGDLCRILDGLRPQAVVCVGYADPEISQAASWALQRGVPLVTCSDSTYDDEPRSWAKEAFKRRIVAAFDAALVAGKRARDYMVTLGMPGDRQFAPWDVVDNGHFERGAGTSRKHDEVSRASLRLPFRYFLCVARFVPKKNLKRLIEAYGSYALRSGSHAWSLVLSGGGPLEAELRAQVAAARLNSQVHFPGFIQYPDLPVYYGLAGALVLPSAADQWGLVVNEAMAAGLPVVVSAGCGCVPELVDEGQNGFTFDPGDADALAGRLAQVSEMDAARLDGMGRRSRAIIDGYSLRAFAEGLDAAVACSLSRPRARASRLTRMLLNLVATRTPGGM